MKKHSYRKLLASLLSTTLVASLIFPALSSAEATPASDQRSPLADTRTTPLFGQHSDHRSLYLTSLLDTNQPLNFVPLSSGTDLITVIVELHHEPVKVMESKAKQSKIAVPDNYAAQFALEQTTFKDALKERLNLQVQHEFTQVLNGFSLKIAANQVQKLLDLPGVKAIHPNEEFKTLPIEAPAEEADTITPFMDKSSKHIGAQSYWNSGFKGKGIRIGVIDTGVDYNHPSLKGAYKGGKDFIDFDDDPFETKPDPKQPRAETDHGTHVAGTIVGRGDPNNPNSPTGWVQGVAPEADLYAYRVLGPFGSGTTESVILGIEQSVKDDLDIINLSLGSSLNFRYSPTSKAVNNAVLAGVTTVVANGNAGPREASVGSPGNADLAISVGASTSPTDVDVFRGAKASTLYPIKFRNSSDLAKSKPLQVIFAQNGSVKDYEGKNVKGKLVLVSRGAIDYNDLAKNATAAGAAALLVHNNDPGDFRGHLASNGNSVPTYSISLQAGQQLKKELDAGLASLTFETHKEADQLARFSSRGPALPDYQIKPDIVAPGVAIRSSVPAWDNNYKNAYAEFGGTSMAAPHIAGAAALVLNKALAEHNFLSPDEIKSLLMNTAKPLESRQGKVLSITDQGAGRIDLTKASESPATAYAHSVTTATYGQQAEDYYSGSVSFGHVDAGATITKHVILQDLAGESQEYTVEATSLHHSSIVPKPNKSHYTVRADEDVEIKLSLHVPKDAADGVYEGFITLTDEYSGDSIQLPYTAYVGDKYALAPIKQLRFSPSIFSPNGDGENDSSSISFTAYSKVNGFSLSVQNAVYGDLGHIYHNPNPTLPDTYQVNNWKGTATKDNNQVELPDGQHEVVPVLHRNNVKLFDESRKVIIDRQAPQYVLDAPSARNHPQDPTKAIISGKIQSDLLLDIYKNFPKNFFIGANVIVKINGKNERYNGTIQENGQFSIVVPRVVDNNEYALFVYDYAGNGIIKPAQLLKYDSSLTASEHAAIEVEQANLLPNTVGPIALNTEVYSGSRAAVDVKYSVTDAVYAAKFTVTHDARLTLASIEPSVQLAVYGPSPTRHPDVILAGGKKQFTYDINFTKGGFKGAGSLAQLTFQTSNEGTYPIELTQVQLLNEAKKPLPIKTLGPANVTVKRTYTPRPDRRSDSGGSSSRATTTSTTSPTTVLKVRTGNLTEVKESGKTNAKLAVDYNVLNAQLKNKDVKQAQLDVSDVKFNKYNQVEIRVGSAITKLLTQSNKDLLLSGDGFEIVIPIAALPELIGADGLTLTLSLTDKDSKLSSADIQQSAAALTIRAAKSLKEPLKTPLLVALKVQADARDALKVGAYTQAQALAQPQATATPATTATKVADKATGVWTYLEAGTKAKDSYLRFKAYQYGTYTLAKYSKTFSDISSHWAKAEIEVIAAHHLLKGKHQESTFYPNDKLTQAEFAALLDRLLGTGVTWEQRSKDRGAHDAITREQVVVKLGEALKADFTKVSRSVNFSDKDSISTASQSAVAYAVSSGFIRGTHDNKFNPQGILSRAEAAVLLYRVLQSLQQK
ncbi:S8 family serine peptidase [Paenibacillus sp. 481]|uniref:S8 family serine peptidase n=1 Tax=Paenibacillus sp. 481 TaxID=2835869 RepID=UPI0022B3D3FD|nr:S8 family serine peptidase [Paenibacillus sp. 481]UHA73158.1 S8 family serine peptidase [Paenibacillus sp. 481]